MLGSINTGGFNKSQVAAMQDSNYFLAILEKVPGDLLVHLDPKATKR